MVAATTCTAADDTDGGSGDTHSLQWQHPWPQKTPTAVATTPMVAVVTGMATDDTHSSSGNTHTHGYRQQQRQDTWCGHQARLQVHDALRMYDKLYFVSIVLVP